MPMALQQNLVLRQDLRMNPRLYQAMDLLYLPLLDLQLHLKTELESNPFLELVEPDEEEVAAEAPAAVKEVEPEGEQGDAEWERILLDGFQVGPSRGEFEESEFTERVASQGWTFDDHLRDQLRMLNLSDRQKLLAEEFVGSIGDDGYLHATLEEIVEGVNRVLEDYQSRRAAELEPESPSDSVPLYTLAEAEDMLETIQCLDPAGTGARNLRECLLLQLREAQEQDTLSYRLVSEGFDDLIARRWSELARRHGLSPRDIQDAADRLARLDPKPGLRFASAAQDYVVPDVVVQKVEGEYRVFLNDSVVPRLRISRVYQDLAADKKKFVGENREFITQKLNSATWLIQAIEQRRQTILKVMNFIVERQREFWEKGVEYLRPLTLREVADAISMHESTVSRVSNQKYAQTPRGTLPLKFFFSSGLATTTGEEASARAVKAQMEKLVAQGDPNAPLTDSELVSAFQNRGIRIARRTVAKYREQLGILPARLRRRV
ncbi:MAG: RNA polymerase factor sigma-54 [Gemmatimonadetes bacterium]|nr:RNA polymerase factor sigma-54 [Gemmatimonadota bacterium]